MSYLTILLLLLCGAVSGIVLFFILAFVNMRGDSGKGPDGEIIDQSNIGNCFDLFAVVFKHPSWLLHLTYKDGTQPFKLLAGDRFSDTYKMRPPK